MYKLSVKPEAHKIFKKLLRKNKKQLQSIHRKLQEIQSNPTHGYKFLRKPLQNFNRVHIDKHFVLIFKINHDEKIVEVYYFGHHDYVYQWQP